MPRTKPPESGEVEVRHVPDDILVGFHYDATLGYSSEFDKFEPFREIQHTLRTLPRVNYSNRYFYEQNELSRHIPKGRFKFATNMRVSELKDTGELQFFCDRDFSKSEEPFGAIKVTR